MDSERRTDQEERGACFCGEIVAELSGTPFWVCYDHDDDCRKAVGSPLMIWVGVRPPQLRLTRGTPKSFSKTSGVTRTFCGTCGTSITYRDEALPDELYIAVGFFDHPERFQPEAHAYWGLKLPWIKFSDRLPKLDGYSRDRDPNLGTPRDRQTD